MNFEEWEWGYECSFKEILFLGNNAKKLLEAMDDVKKIICVPDDIEINNLFFC